jgi:hypothetical protein
MAHYFERATAKCTVILDFPYMDLGKDGSSPLARGETFVNIKQIGAM